MEANVNEFRRNCRFGVAILLLTLLSCFFPKVGLSQPAVLESGMKPNQMKWIFETPLEKVNQQVTFFMKVQRQGNLSQYGTFDYYFMVQVLRPDGSEVWNNRYGFDEKGYAEQVFTFPSFFSERSADRANPTFGNWKIRLVMDEKDSNKEVYVKEFDLSFSGKAGTVYSLPETITVTNVNPFPVIPFKYQLWQLKDWGVGVFDEVSVGSDSYDKEIKVLQCKNSFRVSDVTGAWNAGHKFGVWLTGPLAAIYKNSNKNPLYIFGYILRRPNGDADGANPSYRQSSYCNNPGTVAFPFDLRQTGRYKIEFFLRERDKNYWDEIFWVPIGNLEFTLTE